MPATRFLQTAEPGLLIPRQLRGKVPSLSRLTLGGFTLICFYVACPLWDVPLLGLSLSAPLFFLVALEVFLRPPEAWFRRFRVWIGLAAAIWGGIFLSAMLNGILSGGIDFDRDGAVGIVRYAYWLVVFVITAYVASRPAMGGRLALTISLGLTATVLLRWLEVLTLGNIGAWTGTRFFSQNTYGWLFSTFSPFLLASFFQARGVRRWGWGGALLALWSVAAINGSRGSWIGMLVGLLVFLLLLVVAYPRYLGRVISVLMLVAVFLVLLLAAPEQVVGAVSQRFATLQKLDEDKSYAIRLLMNQKGLRLFAQSPLIGVGVSRWTKESVPLEIPRVLSYAPQSHFDVKSSHNSYLSFLAENGLMGSLPFAFLLGALALRGAGSSVQLARRGALWGLGMFAGFVGMSLHLWAFSGLTNTGTWLMYGLVAAMIETARRLERGR